MALNPIDMQTLVSSADKVAKINTHQQQGAQLAASIQGALQNQEEVRKATTVQELKPGEDRLLALKADPEGRSGGGEAERGKGRRGKPEPSESDPPAVAFTDHRLGTRIDLSG
jgi:hypothetical protein